MKMIELSQNKSVMVDDEDYLQLMQYKWYFSAKTRDVRRYNPKDTTGNTKILMHRFILNCPLGLVVDHIDHNTLNNQKSNLRICTQQQNIMNKPRKVKGTSKYRGVMKHPIAVIAPWWARVWDNGKEITVGWFKTELEAAVARDKAAKLLYGEFASLNFPNKETNNG